MRRGEQARVVQRSKIFKEDEFFAVTSLFLDIFY